MPTSMPALIGFDVPFEPFGLLVNGRPTGMLTELVKALFDRARVPHLFLTMPLAETEPALLEGRVSALAFKGVIPERHAIMDFSSPLIISGAALFTLTDITNALEPNAEIKPHAMHGRRVVTPRKGPLWASLAREHPRIELIDGEGYEQSFAMLRDGRADAAALNLHAGIAIANRLHPGAFHLPSTPYAPLAIAFAVAKGKHPELVAAIDAHLPAFTAEGHYAELERAWLRPSPNSA
jgi:ABC-type amino acid transport substrate-binding protein